MAHVLVAFAPVPSLVLLRGRVEEPDSGRHRGHEATGQDQAHMIAACTAKSSGPGPCVKPCAGRPRVGGGSPLVCTQLLISRLIPTCTCSTAGKFNCHLVWELIKLVPGNLFLPTCNVAG